MIKFLFKKQSTIGGAAALLGFFTILAQILSILKNKLLSVHFGASTDLDIFYTAFKIPDIIFLLVGTMAVGSILIPIFTEKENISIEEKEKFMTRFFNSFSLLLILLSAILFFLIPNIIDYYFSTYQGEEKETLIFLTRLFLLSPIIMGAGNFFITINQRNKIFLPMALTGLFYNISIILGIIFLSPVWGVKGLGYSVIIGAILYLLIQLPSVIKRNLFNYGFEFLNINEMKDLLKITLPRSIALSISSLIILYFYIKISEINQEGLVVIFSFAYTIFWLPITLINSSYSSAMLPVIAKFYSQNKIEKFNNVVREILSRIFFFTIPISFFIFGFSQVVIAAFFSSQKFGITEIKASALLLSLLAIMIPFQILLLVISRIFYSMGKTKPVMWVNILAGSLILIFLYLSQFLNLNLPEDLNFKNGLQDLLILVLIFVISYIVASIFIILKLKNKIKNIVIFNHRRLILKIFISFISLILTKILFWYSSYKIGINFLDNIKIFIIFGSVFVILVLIFSELLKEKNYLDFKEKILMRILRKK